MSLFEGENPVIFKSHNRASCCHSNLICENTTVYRSWFNQSTAKRSTTQLQTWYTQRIVGLSRISCLSCGWILYLVSAQDSRAQRHRFSMEGTNSPAATNILQAPAGLSLFVPDEKPKHLRQKWRGNLQIKGLHNTALIPAVAVAYPTTTRPQVSDTQAWPSLFVLDSTTTTSCASVFPFINEAASEWYVRIAPVDEDGNGKEDSRLQHFLELIVQKQLAYEIDCDGIFGRQGTLYLWGMPIPEHGLSLLGVFRPKTENNQVHNNLSVASLANLRTVHDTNYVKPAENSGFMGLNSDRVAVAAARARAAARLAHKTPTHITPGPVQQVNNTPVSGAHVYNTAASGLATTAGAPGMPIKLEPTEEAVNSGDRVWKGMLRVEGHRNDLVLPCVAVRYPTPTRPPVHDAPVWPAEIVCNSAKLKHSANVFKYLVEPASQWCVRFAPIDEEGKEVSDPKLVQLVKVMLNRQLAFEIDCEEDTVAHGTLYLLGMPMPPHGLSLLGIFRPQSADNLTNNHLSGANLVNAGVAHHTSGNALATISDLMGVDSNVFAAAAAAGAASTDASKPLVPTTPTQIPPGPGQQLNNSPASGTHVSNTVASGPATTLGAPGMPIKPEPTEEAANSGDRIWRGSLYVRGHRNEMTVPCVAMRYQTPTRPPVHGTQGWPARIHCDSSKLKQCSKVFKYINEPASQWYVRFAAVDEEGKEVSDPKLVQLVKVMVNRQLAFEIDCEECTNGRGTLFLWGMPMPPHGVSLLGVFRPKPAQHPANNNLPGANLANTEAAPHTDDVEPEAIAASVDVATELLMTVAIALATRATSLLRQRATQITPDPVQQLNNAPVLNSTPSGLATTPGNAGMPVKLEPTEEAPSSGDRIWRGTLHVNGLRNSMVVPCAAIRHSSPSHPPLLNTQAWPAQIHCDSPKIKPYQQVSNYMNEPATQWHVQFVPVDDDEEGSINLRMSTLVKAMAQRQLVFEIECREGMAGHGTLFLRGIPMPPDGHSMIGVFRPTPDEDMPPSN